MNITDIIEIKKNGGALTRGQTEFAVNGFVSGEVADYQMSALLMAICLKGMNAQETADLTDIMAASGDSVDLSAFTLTADKHSTGGVGDKTTLITAPLAAALGCTVAKMSGRGLGHTGGTIDKLESVPGFTTELTPEQFAKQARDIGIVVAGQTGNLVPADKKLYALRDVTDTVNSIPLIASSIMSKKLVCGAGSIVLDVKTGSGAFMQTLPEARALAREMTACGTRCGRKTAAVITDMDIPLGRAAGNAIEVEEAVRVLHAGGDERLKELSVVLAARMLCLASGEEYEQCLIKARRALEDGSALTKARQWFAAQGGDCAVLDGSVTLKKAPIVYEVKAPCSGYITRMDANTVGRLCVLTGAGRVKKGDTIDPGAGVYLDKVYGEHVNCGQTVARIYTSKPDIEQQANELFLSALSVSGEKPAQRPVVYETIL